MIYLICMLSTHNAAADTSMISKISRQINGENFNFCVCDLGVQNSVEVGGNEPIIVMKFRKCHLDLVQY